MQTEDDVITLAGGAFELEPKQLFEVIKVKIEPKMKIDKTKRYDVKIKIHVCGSKFLNIFSIEYFLQNIPL
jgi:hypothetical protein